MLDKINIGSGKDYREGYLNYDISYDVGADVVGDITDQHFIEDSFEEVICNNVLTQILEPQKFVKVMQLLWHMTKPTGSIYVRVPLVTNEAAWQDPLDCRRFTKESFTYMEDGHRRFEQYGRGYGFKPFKVEILSNNDIQMEVKLTPVK